MKTKSYGSHLPRDNVQSEVNRLVRELIQELRSISNQSNFTMVDLTEMFVGNLLKRLGVPIEEEYDDTP